MAASLPPTNPGLGQLQFLAYVIISSSADSVGMNCLPCMQFGFQVLYFWSPSGHRHGQQANRTSWQMVLLFLGVFPGSYGGGRISDMGNHPRGVLKNAGIGCLAAGQSLVRQPGLLPGSNRKRPKLTTDSLGQAIALHKAHGM